MDTKLLIILFLFAFTIETTTPMRGIIATRRTYILRTTPITNETRLYSPLTLGQEWSALGRLLLTLACAFIGSLMNGFFVATFFLRTVLSRAGNIFLACMGLADMFITLGVLPVPGVLILSGELESLWLCYLLQIIAEASTYSYSLFFMLVAVETFVRLCRPPTDYLNFIDLPIGCLSVLIFAVSFLVASTGIYFGLDYDYCLRKSIGNYTFRSITMILFHGIPFMVTMICFIAASISVHQRAQRHIHYGGSLLFNQDFSTTLLNIIIFLFFVMMWLPYNIIVFFYPNSSDKTFYNCVWIGISRSVFSSLLYGSILPNFRHAYFHLCNYCWFKNNINGRVRNHRRNCASRVRESSGIRVHVMQMKRLNGALTPRNP